MNNKHFRNMAATTSAALAPFTALLIFGAAGCRSGSDAPAPAVVAGAQAAATAGKSPNQIANDLAMRTGHATQSTVATSLTSAPMTGPITGTPNQMAAELARRSFGAKAAAAAR